MHHSKTQCKFISVGNGSFPLTQFRVGRQAEVGLLGDSPACCYGDVLEAVANDGVVEELTVKRYRAYGGPNTLLCHIHEVLRRGH